MQRKTQSKQINVIQSPEHLGTDRSQYLYKWDFVYDNGKRTDSGW